MLEAAEPLADMGSLVTDAHRIIRPAVHPCAGSQDTGEHELLTLNGENGTGPLRGTNRLAVMDRAVPLGPVAIAGRSRISKI